MTRHYSINNIRLHIAAAIVLLATLLPSGAGAFNLSTYTENSRMASGRWVKISVDADGIYLLSNTQMRKMGFTDPSKVHIYGYGGRQLPDRLTERGYIDDLPMVQTMRTDRGLLFYAEGVTQAVTQTGRYVRPKQNA